MSRTDDAAHREQVALASEEVTRRNVVAAIDHGNQTRKLTNGLIDQVEKNGHAVRAVTQRFDQHMIAFAGQAQNLIAQDAEVQYLRRKVDQLEVTLKDTNRELIRLAKLVADGTAD